MSRASSLSVIPQTASAVGTSREGKQAANSLSVQRKNTGATYRRQGVFYRKIRGGGILIISCSYVGLAGDEWQIVFSMRRGM